MRRKHSRLFVLAAVSFSCFVHAAPVPPAAGTIFPQQAIAPIPVTGAALSGSKNRDFQLGYQAALAENYSVALGYLDKAGSTPAADFLRGRIYAALGRQADAVSSYSAALAQQPHSIEILFARAVAYRNLKNSPQALADFNAVLALDPDAAFGYLGRGLLLQEMGENEKAAGDMLCAARRLVKTNPSVAASSYTLASGLYSDAKRNEEAIAAASAALRLTPDQALLYALRGTSEYRIGDYGNALIDFENAVRLNPQDVDSRAAIGRLLEAMGQLQAALDEFAIVFASPQTDPGLYIDRADVLMDMGRYEEAMADYDAAAKLDPQSAWLIHQRIQGRFYVGDYSGAVQDADLWLSTAGKKATETNVAYTHLFRHLAMQRQGLDDRAFMAAAIDGMKNRKGWPYALMQYSAHQINERQLAAAVSRGTPEELPQRQCEAAAYIGERQLSLNQPARAEEQFRYALEVCPYAFVERMVANHGLKDIGKTAMAQPQILTTPPAPPAP